MTRMLMAVIGFASLGMLLGSCGGGEPTAVSTAVPAGEAQTISLGKDISLQIPAGALSADATVTISRVSDEDLPPGELPGAQAAGNAFKIDLGGATLSKPATLTISYDKALLPEDTPEDAVFVAYFDEEKKAWVPAGGRIDPEKQVVVIETTHLSWWNPFSWNWPDWKEVLESTLSLELGKIWDSTRNLTESCTKSTDNITVDESQNGSTIAGCIDKEDPASPELRVENLRLFDISVRAAGEGSDLQPQVLAPDGEIRFKGNPGAQPQAIVQADFSADAMVQFLISVLLRAVPGGDLVPLDARDSLVQVFKQDSRIAEAIVRWGQGDWKGAVEKIGEALVGQGLVEAFLNTLQRIGEERGIDMLKKIPTGFLSQVFRWLKLSSFLVQMTDFLTSHPLEAGPMGTVTFGWTPLFERLHPTPTPTPPPPATFTDPFAYCEAVGTTDGPDSRWVGAPTPDVVAAAFPAAYYDPAVTIWRCMGGQVWACNLGVNLPCGKADTSTEIKTRWCQNHPDSDFIPLSDVGHANIYKWRCVGTVPTVVRQIYTVDDAGFIADFWRLVFR